MNDTYTWTHVATVHTSPSAPSPVVTMVYAWRNDTTAVEQPQEARDGK